MTTEDSYKCMRCKTITEQSGLDNRQWFGWRYVDGKAVTVPVNNYCCPHCGSNDLVHQYKAA